MRRLRGHTLLIGLVQGVAWAVSYPFFIGGIQTVAAFGPNDMGMLFPLLLPLVAVLVVLAALALFFSSCVNLGVTVLAKWLGYRLEGRLTELVLQLSVLFAISSSITLSISLELFPPDFLLSPPPSGKQYLYDENKIHTFLWPFGTFVITIALAMINALITAVILRNSDAGRKIGLAPHA